MDELKAIDAMTANTLFFYDVKGDTIRFGGNYKHRLFAKEKYEQFLNNMDENMLVEKEYKQAFEKVIRRASQKEISSEDVLMLTAEEKYELFNVKCCYLQDRGEVFGMCRNIDRIRKADTDSLTGLLNREGIEKNLENVLGDTTKDSRTALLMIDLDNFKQVNDTHGHLVGDQVLKDISTIIKGFFGSNSKISRLGGDEFLVCVHPVLNEQLLDSIVDQLRASIEQYGAIYGVSASIGVSVASDNIAFQKLFKQADMATYAAKGDGKNKYRFYDPEMIISSYIGDRDRTVVEKYGESKEIDYLPLITTVLNINNSSISVREKIEESCKVICDFFEVDRVHANCYMPDGSRVGKSYFYSRSKTNTKNIRPHIKIRRDEFVKNYNSDGIFFCTDVKSVNEPIRSELLKMNVKSFLQVLMYTEDGEVLGCLGANAIYVRLWNQRELDTFVALAKIMTKTVRELQAICVKELEETGKVEWE